MPVVDINLDGGLVLHDPRKQPPGSFSVLDNAEFAPVRRRHGHRSLPFEGPGDVVNGSLDAWALGFGQYVEDDASPDAESAPGQLLGTAVHQNEILGWDGWRMFSRDPSPTAKAVRIGGSTGLAILPHAKETAVDVGEHYIPPSVGPPTVAVGANEYEVIDIAVGKYRTMYAWTFDGSCYYKVFDNETGTPVVPKTLLSYGATISHCRVAYSIKASGAGTFYVIASTTGSSILAKIFAEQRISPTYAPTQIDVNTGCPADGEFDVRPASEGRVLVASLIPDTAAESIRLTYLYPSGSTSGSTYTADDATNASDLGLAIHPDGSVLLSWSSATEVRAAFFDGATLARIGAEVAVATAVADRVSCEFRLHKDSGRYVGAVAYWTTADREVVMQCLDQATVLGAPATVAYSWLSHQMFRVGDAIFVPVGHVNPGSTLQGQLVILALDSGPLAADPSAAPLPLPVASSLRSGKWFPGLSTVPVKMSTCALPEQDPVNPAKFSVVSLTGKVRPSLAADGETVTSTVTQDGAARVDYDFLPPLRSTKVGRSTWFAGGLVREYDGLSIQEAGFLTFPEPTVAVVADTDSTFTAGQVIQYRAYLVRRNAQGELHRSAAITKRVTVTTDGDHISVTLPPVPYTSQDVTWEVYKTDPNGVLFKLWTTEGATAGHTRSLPLVLDDDGSVDISLNPTDPAPSYTDAGFGLLDRIIPPSCEIISAGKQRVWFAGGGVPDHEIAYTRLWDSTEAPAWNEALVAEIPGSGAITGIGFLGDWCVPFREDIIGVFGGGGPDNLGSGTFDDCRQAVAETGCVSPDSLISLLPIGLGFQGHSGIRVIDQGMNVSPIGDAVDSALTSDNLVVCAAVGRKAKQARFTTANDTYVLDYSEAGNPRWTRWTYSAHGAAEYQGRVIVAPRDIKNCLWLEDEDEGTDGGIRYTFDCSTSWLYPAGAVMGWGRLDWIALVGDWLGPHKFRGRIDYDHRIAPVVDDWTWEPNEAVAGLQDVGSAPMSGDFGAETPPAWYQDGPYLGRRRFRKSRAGAFRVSLSDTGAPGPSFSLSGISIEHRPSDKLGKWGSRNYS